MPAGIGGGAPALGSVAATVKGPWLRQEQEKGKDGGGGGSRPKGPDVQGYAQTVAMDVGGFGCELALAHGFVGFFFFLFFGLCPCSCRACE